MVVSVARLAAYLGIEARDADQTAELQLVLDVLLIPLSRMKHPTHRPALKTWQFRDSRHISMTNLSRRVGSHSPMLS